MAATLWDVLEKAANLAQLCGLHAAMLVAVAMSLLWNPESKKECAKLVEYVRELRELLQWPTGCAIVMQDTDMGGLISKALRDADGLVDSYNMSTLWRRIRSGQSMAAQFRDMHNRINNYCRFVLIINGHLLMQAMNYPSDPDTRIHQVNDPPQTVQAVAECPTGAEPPQRANGIGQEGVGAQPGNTDDPGCDIVISNA